MIYFWLALVALVFAFLGFLVHAFYFSKESTVEKLEAQLEGLKTALSSREKENADAREEIRKTRNLAEALELRLEQRNEQLKGIQATAKKQEEEIRALQKAAAEVRLSIAQAEQRSEPAIPDSQPGEETEGMKIPLWKDNLNNILGMLDKIEKEVKK